MTEFETLMTCIIVSIGLVFTYLAGRIDFLNVVVKMFEEKAEQMKEGADADPNRRDH